MKTIVSVAALAILGLTLTGCEIEADSDDTQRSQQERILKEATSQTGMPAIKNFRERKLLKQIIDCDLHLHSSRNYWCSRVSV